jgi:hypothetical protein
MKIGNQIQHATAIGVLLANGHVNSFHPSERLPYDDGNLKPGNIYLANEARFTSSFFSEPLTNYTLGWKDNNNIEATLDFLMPPIQVPRRFEYKAATNAEAFLSEVDDVRAIGADFKRVEYKGTSVNDKTLNKGLTIRVDQDQVQAMPNWREVYTTRLLQRILRNELRRAVTAVTAQRRTPPRRGTPRRARIRTTTC